MAKLYTEMSADELKAEQKVLENRYNDFKAKNLKLDMSRGKPGADQLDLSDAMNTVDSYISDGVDIRNYGIMDGIPSCKKLFADLMGVEPKNVIVGPNASLTLMFDYISQCFTHGAGDTPWCKLDDIKFLCPVFQHHFQRFRRFTAAVHRRQPLEAILPPCNVMGYIPQIQGITAISVLHPDPLRAVITHIKRRHFLRHRIQGYRPVHARIPHCCRKTNIRIPE